MIPEALIIKHRLEPHPFEGWWRVTKREPGKTIEGLQLLGAMDEASWHRFPTDTVYALEDGGPVVISLSEDGTQAHATRLVAPGDQVRVEAGALRALSCLGAAALLRVTMTPDCPLTDRQLMPDDWFPRG